MITALRILLILAIGPSCATTKSGGRPQIPAIYEPFFSASCYPSDGETFFELSQDREPKFSSDMVWNLKSSQKWDIEWTSGIGLNLCTLSYDGSSTFTGPCQDSAPRVVTKPNGSIEAAGYMLPFLASEIGCIIQGRWPARWRESLAVTSHGRDQMSLSGSLQNRNVELVLKNQNSNGIEVSSCAQVSWDGFLGFFAKRASICTYPYAKQVRMTLPHGFAVILKQDGDARF
jgi:hypothetical protein